MVDFVDNPWLGGLVNSLHERGVLISLICHAPVVMASAKCRASEDGVVRTDANHAFFGAHLTTVPRHGEKIALSIAYPKVPRQRTRLEYFADDRLRAEGYDVDTNIHPTGVRVVWKSESACSPATARNPPTPRPTGCVNCSTNVRASPTRRCADLDRPARQCGSGALLHDPFRGRAIPPDPGDVPNAQR
jgi:hypothetical protein